VLLVRLLDELAVFLPAGTLESFRADLGLTYAQAGAVLAAIAPGAVIGSVFAAAADRYSRRVIAAGGAFGFAAALALFAAGAGFPVLAAAAFGMGMASTAMVDAAEVALVDLAGDDLRRYLARGNLLATIGDLLGPALIACVALAGLSWRGVFATGAVLMGLYAAVLAVTPLPPPFAGADGDGDGDLDDQGVGAVIRDPAVWAMGLLGLAMGPFDETLIGFVIALLEHDRGVSPAVATAVAFTGLGGGLLSFTILARRLEHVDDGRVLLLAVWAMTAGAVAMVACPVLPVVAAAAFAESVGLNLGWLAVQHRSLTLRPGQVGRTKAVLGVIEFSGFWIPICIGAVADRSGLRPALGAFVVLGLAMVALASRDQRRAVTRRRPTSPGSIGRRSSTDCPP
jgi:MFS family permease